MISVRGKTPRNLDQFFTLDSIAQVCVSNLKSAFVSGRGLETLDFMIEPSCGTGAFVRALSGSRQLMYIDIDSTDETRRKDFLKDNIVPGECFHGKNKKKAALTIGNPPFGKNSSLAIDFFNRAAEFSDIIAFIVPRTFEKESTMDKLNLNFFLVKQTPIESNGFVFSGTVTDVPCVFQIWAHVDALERFETRIKVPEGRKRLKQRRLSDTVDFEFVKVNELPDLIIRRVGVLAGRIYTTDLERWTTLNHFFIRIRDRSRVKIITTQLISLELEMLPSKYATAGMPSISKHELCEAYNKKYHD
jgi:predicted RNA methylase